MGRRQIDLNKILRLLTGNVTGTIISSVFGIPIGRISQPLQKQIFHITGDIISATVGDCLQEKIFADHLGTVNDILNDSVLRNELNIQDADEYDMIRAGVELILSDDCERIKPELMDVGNIRDFGAMIQKWSETVLADKGYSSNDKKYILSALNYAADKIIEWVAENNIIDIALSLVETENELSEAIVSLKQNRDEVAEQLHKLNERISRLEESRQQSEAKRIYNRVQMYLDRWNSNLFLNDYDKRDEEAGVNITLEQLYVLPKYRYGENAGKHSDLEELLLGEEENWKMMLIFGLPGGGKTTLLTWYVHKYLEKYGSIHNIILVKSTELFDSIRYNKGAVLLEEMLSKCVQERVGTWHNKILIIDGFDESNLSERNQILEKFYCLLFENAYPPQKVIITCRENYMLHPSSSKYKHIHLCAFEEDEIDSFVEKFESAIGKKVCVREQLVKNKQVYGVPIILYMILSLNIPIDEEASEVDVYDRIFNFENGIYDRCFKIKNREYEYAEKTSHSEEKIKGKIHQLSRNIALWMFENNPESAALKLKDFAALKNELTLENENYLDYYFEVIRHCEGTDGEEGCNIEFVHRTIYEYFVVEQIYAVILYAWNNREKPKSDLIGSLPFFLKKGIFTPQMELYFSKKIQNLTVGNSKLFFEWWNENFCLLIENGMFFGLDKETVFGNSINLKDLLQNCCYKEINCFDELIRLSQIILQQCSLQNEGECTAYIGDKTITRKLLNYLTASFGDENSLTPGSVYSRYLNRNLRGFMGLELSGTVWKEILLNKINFRYANLENAVFDFANLSKADFSEANLKNACFWDSPMFGIKVKNAELNDATVYTRTKRKEEMRRLFSGKFDYINLKDEKTCQRVSREQFESRYKNDNLY